MSTSALDARVEQLVECREMKEALELLERAGRDALRAQDVAALEQVLRVSQLVHARAAERRHRNQAVEIMNAARQNIRSLAATDERRSSERGRRRVRWIALVVWAILIVGTSWVLGGASGSAAAWFAVDAVSGAVLGVLFVLFVSPRDETGRGFTDVVGFLVGGAVVYSTVYGIAIIAAGHHYDSNQDPNGTFGAIVWLGLCGVCIIPMLVTAGLLDRARGG